MSKYANYDLHLHSYWSYDAHADIRDYFRLAQKRRTRAFAITDHHLMDGYEELYQIAKEFPEVSYIVGAELTVYSPAGTFDMVCLGLPRQPTPELQGVFEAYRNWQVACGTAISTNLMRLGYNFDDKARLKLLKSYRPAQTIAKQGITHVKGNIMRRHMLDIGVSADPQEIAKILWQTPGIPDYPAYDFVLPAVRRAGAVCLIAHPYDYFNQLDRKRMSELREMLNFDGIECAHPSLSVEHSKILRTYCLEHDLLSSAGSDAHTIEPDNSDPEHIIEFARHCGEEQWLDEILQRVKLYGGE